MTAAYDVLARVLSATPTPAPTTPDPDSVTPGLLGFLVVFFLALATWLLLRNMTGRLRRMRFREAQRIESEQDKPMTPDDGPS